MSLLWKIRRTNDPKNHHDDDDILYLENIGRSLVVCKKHRTVQTTTMKVLKTPLPHHIRNEQPRKPPAVRLSVVVRIGRLILQLLQLLHFNLVFLLSSTSAVDATTSVQSHTKTFGHSIKNGPLPANEEVTNPPSTTWTNPRNN